MDRIKCYMHVPTRREEVFENCFYAGQQSNGAEYWMIGNGLGEVAVPRQWYKNKDPKAIIVRFSSILIAMAAIEEIRRMAGMQDVEIAFMKDHCAEKLPAPAKGRSRF
jgi:hypothetical protein